MTTIVTSVALFILAGLCEIGGGYLVWQSWRTGAWWLAGLAGTALLVGYGFVPTYQAAHFSRVYAPYGGAFIMLAVFWESGVGHIAPDRYDLSVARSASPASR
jgi:small multidrug resistance family-3 protein